MIFDHFPSGLLLGKREREQKSVLKTAKQIILTEKMECVFTGTVPPENPYPF